MNAGTPAATMWAGIGLCQEGVLRISRMSGSTDERCPLSALIHRMRLAGVKGKMKRVETAPPDPDPGREETPAALRRAQKTFPVIIEKGACRKCRKEPAPGFVRRACRSKFNLEDVDPTKC